MLALMIMSILGLIVSSVVHFCMIFDLYYPPGKLVALIHIGVIFVFYPALIISKKMRGKVDIKDFNNSMLNACPRWMTIMSGTFVLYALVGLIFFALNRHLPSSTIIAENGVIDNSFRGFSGHLMAFYSLTFTILYSCRSLQESDEIYSGSEGDKKESI